MFQNFSSKLNQLDTAKVRSSSGARSYVLSVVVFLVLFALTLGLQVRSGAYESDFGGHPDEAAHVVTGLMVRDYLAGPFWSGTHPMRYAEDYYDRFPKVAIGHYPPGFYVIEGLWLLPSRSHTAALLLPAFLTALTAWIIFMTGRKLMNFPAALAVSVIFPLMNLVQTYTAIVMSDMLLVIWCLLATLAFSRFLATGFARWSLAFGFLAAAAILTKGSGLLLALVPPVAILLTARFRILLAPKLWLAPVPVLLLAVPWLVMTTHITSEGMSAAPLNEYFLQAIPYYSSHMVSVLGIALMILAIVAVGLGVKSFRREKGLPATEAALWGLVVAVFFFYCAVPSGLDERYLLPVIPPMLMLGFAALDRIASQVRDRVPAISPISIVAALALLVGWEAFGSPGKMFTGHTQVVDALLEKSDKPLNLLICSDARGEGALVAAAALIAPDRIVVQRGTKLLSSSDWLGRGYAENFANENEMLEILKESEITHVVVDKGVPESSVWPHQISVGNAIKDRPDRFTDVREIPALRRDSRSHLTVATISN